jgi:hypothetical protein
MHGREDIIHEVTRNGTKISTEFVPFRVTSWIDFSSFVPSPFSGLASSMRGRGAA